MPRFLFQRIGHCLFSEKPFKNVAAVTSIATPLRAVFGELEAGRGATKPKVSLMMIGEQPGDNEDKEGRPFVGPAGRLLDLCLGEAGIDRRNVYVTNTLKHFKWEPRGKLRIHKETQHDRDSRLSTLVGSGVRHCETEAHRMFGCGSLTVSFGFDL